MGTRKATGPGRPLVATRQPWANMGTRALASGTSAVHFVSDDNILFVFGNSGKLVAYEVFEKD